MVFRLFGSTEASRKYMDLIYSASTTWANWDPTRKVIPGDFGQIDRFTGQFKTEGNIWTYEETKETAKAHSLALGPIRDVEQIVSRNAKGSDMDVAPYASIAGLSEAPVKAQFEFGEKRGAALIMNKPQTTFCPDELLRALELGRFRCLRKKVLVTSVSACSSYAMYLSGSQDETVKVAFLGNSPLPVDPATTGGEVNSGWWSSNYTGTFERAHNPTESFFPVYTTSTLEGNVRRETPDPDAPPPSPGSRYPPNTTFSFMRTMAPWNPLLEDGKELVYESESDGEDIIIGDGRLILT